MRKKTFFLIALSFVAASQACAADDAKLDNSSAEALIKTQELLRDPTRMEMATRENPLAKGAEDSAKAAAGNDPQVIQEIHELTANIFEKLVRDSNGDAIGMAELMEKIQKDPAAFEKILTPAQLSQIQAIAKRAPASSK